MEEDMKKFLEKEAEQTPVQLSSLLAEEFPEPKWIIDNLIPHGGLNLISADPGSGKTWLALLIALSVAQGIPLFEQINTFQTGVLFIEEEMGKRRLKERLLALSAKADASIPIYFKSRSAFKVDNPAKMYNTLQFCESKSIGLIILDSFVRLHNAKEENSASEMAKVFQQIGQFSNNGITAIITHHHRKQAAGSKYDIQSPRGSSDITAAVDSHLSINKKGDILTISNPKARYNKNADDLKVQMEIKEGLINFQLLGQVENIPKEERMKRIILQTLKEAEFLQSKQALHSELIKLHKDVPRNLYLSTLEELIQAGEIIASRGPKNMTFLKLKLVV